MVDLHGLGGEGAGKQQLLQQQLPRWPRLQEEPGAKKMCRPNYRNSQVREVLGAKMLRGSSNNRLSSSAGNRNSSSQGISTPGPTMKRSHVVSTTSNRSCNRRKIVEF